MTQAATTLEPAATIPASAAWWKKEDWMAVWLGALVLLLILSGMAPAVRPLRWADVATASALLSPTVIGPWLLMGALAWVLSAAGIALGGGNVRRYACGFPVVF